VARGDHQARVGTTGGGVEIDLFRPAHADGQDTDAAVEQPLRERAGKAGTVLPHVMADDDRIAFS